VPASFFGLNVVNTQITPWPDIPFNAIRDFQSSWIKLQPQKDDWHFERLDQDVDLAQQHHADLMLSLGTTPTWASARPEEHSCCGPGYPMGSAAEPRDLNDWRNYVRTVATRYKGKVHVYELWNEANMDKSFSGIVPALVTISRAAYEVLKQVDPSIIVVSPPFSSCCDYSGYLKKYFGAGGGRYSDAIGYHAYTGHKPPEVMVGQLAVVKDVMHNAGVTQPLWDTEAGWIIGSERDPHSVDENLGGAYLVRAFLLNWASGVERFYWYNWDADLFGMTRGQSQRKEPVIAAYRQAAKWLVGATVSACAVESAGTWVCQLSRGPSYTARIVWHPDGNTQFPVPAAWGASQMTTLKGEVSRIAQNVTVGDSPVLIDAGNARNDKPEGK
jgi:hypothetical protein